MKFSAQAGFKEANDIHILIQRRESGGIIIDLESPVMRQFGRDIQRSIRETAERICGLENIYIKAIDGGALDYTIRARVETAVKRLNGGESNGDA